MDLTQLNGGKPMGIEPVEEKTYGPLKPGRYNIECVKVDECQDASGEKSWDELEYVVVDHNRKVWQKLYWQGYSETAFDIADEFRRRAQAALEIQEMYSTKELVGQTLSAELVVKEYNGKERNEVIAGSVKAADKGDSTKAKTPAPAPAPSSNGASKDEIPF